LQECYEKFSNINRSCIEYKGELFFIQLLQVFETAEQKRYRYKGLLNQQFIILPPLKQAREEFIKYYNIHLDTDEEIEIVQNNSNDNLDYNSNFIDANNSNNNNDLSNNNNDNNNENNNDDTLLINNSLAHTDSEQSFVYQECEQCPTDNLSPLVITRSYSLDKQFSCSYRFRTIFCLPRM
jgi:hypothetical protein